MTLSTAGKVLNPATKIFAATNIINSYIISAVAAPVYDDRATLLFAPERSRLGLTSFLSVTACTLRSSLHGVIMASASAGAGVSGTAATHPYTCNTCQVAYRNIDLQKTHMKSDWQ